MEREYSPFWAYSRFCVIEIFRPRTETVVSKNGLFSYDLEGNFAAYFLVGLNDSYV